MQQGKYDSMEAKPHYGPVGGKTDFDVHTCRWMWWKSRAWLRVRWRANNNSRRACRRYHSAPNDSDRLRKYLARFDLDWERVRAAMRA